MTDSEIPANASSPTTSGVGIAFPAKVLQKVVADKLSGRITIQDPNDVAISWRIYVGNGQVHYVNSMVGQEERLSYLLQRYCPALKPAQSLTLRSDYDFLYQFWQSGQLSLQQLRKLIFLFSQEALVHFLALPQARTQVERTLGLEQLVLSVPLKEIVLPIRPVISQWAQMRNEISSPFQRPYLLSTEQLAFLLAVDPEKYQRLQTLESLLEQNLCLYQLARLLKLDVTDLANSLRTLVAGGAIGLRPYNLPQIDERPLVACIDDSKTVQRNVQLILEASGYRVLGLTEPARALTILARQKPALVLMDIGMPDIDGYELCRMLRQSSLLKETPIIMLTGRDGLIDRIRSRMVGATDYLTKPFNPHELLSLTEKLIHDAPMEVS